MAPDEPNRKRKHGRPAGVSKPDENVSIRGGEAVQQVSRHDNEEAQVAPRRRGRPARTQEVEHEVEEAVAQAEETSNPEPKKRGRKPRAQEVEQPPEEMSVAEAEVPADSAPKRRGRPARAQEVEQEANPTNKAAGESIETAPKRRERPARVQEADKELEQPTVAETEESPDSGRKKRGRPAKSQDAEPEEPEQAETRPRKRAKAAENVNEEQQQEDEPRGRGRPGRKQTPAQQEDTEMQDAEPTETDGRRRRRGRVSSEDESHEEAAAEPEPEQKDKSAKNASKSKGKPGRVIQQEDETQEESQSSVRRGGRGRKSAESAAQPSPESNQTPKEPQKRSKKGPRGTLTEVSVSEAQNQTSSKQSKTKPQPQREAEPEQEEPQSPPSQAPYRHLAPKTLHIPRSTIRSKWTPLDPPAIATIDALILDSYIPILESLSSSSHSSTNTTRYTHSQTILRTFASRLHSKLVKGMPFPPASIGSKTTKGITISAQEAELNFEKVVDASENLQRQLDPLLHSVSLLKAEKEREEKGLEKDYRELRKLEENARAQARGWRERDRRGHVLAPGRRDHSGAGEWDGEGERGVEVVVKKEKEVVGSVFAGVGEGEEGRGELVGLARQIGNHMESMRGNLGQVEGVVDAIQKSRAALQGVLGGYLSEEAFEGVVLG